MTDTAAPVAAPLAAPFDMPPPSASFDARAGWLLNRLVADLGITEIQAAGICGNLGGESGLEAIQEKHPLAGRGGFGWEQPTGPRRVSFEQFCAAHFWNTTDDLANYGFMLQELNGSEAHALTRLKLCTTVKSAVYTFEVYFERPLDPEAGVAPREAFAERALAAAPQATNAPGKVLTPAAPPVSAAAVSPATPPLSTIHTAISTGAAGFPAYGVVTTIVWALSLDGVAVPIDLQNVWLGLLMVAGAAFVHTRLAAWLNPAP